MKRRMAATWLFAGIMAVCGAAGAQSIALGIRAGTLGPGAEAAIALSGSLGIRVGANYLPVEYNDTYDDIEYDVDLVFKNASALLDWHPFQGAFRLSGGVIWNGNDLETSARPTADVEIGDTTYTREEVGSLSGVFDFEKIAPYAGLGWDTSFGKNGAFGFVCDLGVMYQDAPQVALSASGGLLSSDPAFLAELAKEEAKIQDEIDDYKFYPVVALGLIYRF